MASTVFVVYLSAGQPEEQTWNALFWIVQLFVSVNAVAKSFLQDSKGRMLYYYTISGAGNYIIAKMIFNALLMMIMSLLTFLIFILLLGNPVVYFIEFLCLSFLGGIGPKPGIYFSCRYCSKSATTVGLNGNNGISNSSSTAAITRKNLFKSF